MTLPCSRQRAAGLQRSPVALLLHALPAGTMLRLLSLFTSRLTSRLASLATSLATSQPAARHATQLTLLAALLLPVLLSGCAAAPQHPPGAAAAPLSFGAATRAALALQIVNPDAGQQAQARGEAVAGQDGRAASQAQGRYQKSYGEAAPQQGSFTIGVSGGK